jgi:DNA polymerase-3 subunit gamma/tau
MALLRMLAFRPAASGQPRAPAAPVVAKPPVGRGRTVSSADAPAPPPARLEGAEDWLAFVAGLALDGAVRQLAVHTEFASLSPFELRLSLERSNAHLLTDQLRGRFVSAVQARLGPQVKVQFDVRDATANSAADRDARRAEENLRKARQAIEADANVKDMVELFGASVVAGSVRPVAGAGPENK